MTKRKDPRPSRGEVTEKVRVRAPNPLIERRPATAEAEPETALVDDDHAERRGGLMDSDDDATVIAETPPTRPPKPPPRPDDPIAVYVFPSEPRAPPPKAPGRGPPRVVPKSRMMMPGTKGFGAMAAQARIEAIADAIPAVTEPALRMAAPYLDAQVVGLVEGGLRGAHEPRDSRTALDSPKRNLERLIFDPSFGEREPSVQAQLLRLAAEAIAEPEALRALARLVQSGGLAGLAGPDERALLDAVAATAPRHRRLFATLAERRVRERSSLADRDVRDVSIAQHLQAIARLQRLDPALSVSASDAHLFVLSTLAGPERMPLEEGPDGVLGMVEFALADACPAECARLWRQLLAEPQSADLPSEVALTYAGSPHKPSLAPHQTPLRLALERLIGRAHPRSGPRRESLLMSGATTLDADVLARLLSLLFGVSYQVAAGPVAVPSAIEVLAAAPQRNPPAFVTLLDDRGERLFVFDHLAADRLFVRAPHGTSTKAAGAKRLDPTRTVEDPTTGLESFPRAVFDEALGVLLVPRG